MTRSQPTDLAQLIQRFFEDYLPALRGMSTHTVRSYRDAIVLWLRFAARDAGRRIERLTLSDLTADRIERFLRSLERDRHNCVGTRNTRLAALHTFARFLVQQRPASLAQFQTILAIPFKRGSRQASIEYFESHELDALFKSIDRRLVTGCRAYALFALMFNTGARVQEILNLRIEDLRLEPPYQVRLHGKGHKIRTCPLWPATMQSLRVYLERSSTSDALTSGRPLFINRNGGPLTRFGVRYLLRKYVAATAATVTTLQDKHLIRTPFDIPLRCRC